MNIKYLNHMTKTQRATCLSLLTLTVFMGACGGGDSDNDAAVKGADPADKYVGSWVRGCQDLTLNGRAMSTGQTVTFTKTSANTVDYSAESRDYTTNNCTGAYVVESQGRGYSIIDGTMLDSAGRTVDKLTTEDLVDPLVKGRYKSMAWIDGKRLYTPSINSPKNAEGYPTTLNTSRFATKQ